MAADRGVRQDKATLNMLIERATTADAQSITILVGELLGEIMNAMGIQAFNFELEETKARLEDFLSQEKYFVFVARDGSGGVIGFVALFESYALYAEGAFGTIPELYVRPQYRSQGIGQRLVRESKAFGAARGWKRLEVTTPPLPQFEKTLAFYKREGFGITGGRKLKVAL